MKNLQDNQEAVIGIHAVTELLMQRPGSVSRLLIQHGRSDKRIHEIRELAAGKNVAIEELSKEAFEREQHAVRERPVRTAERPGSSTTITGIGRRNRSA